MTEISVATRFVDDYNIGQFKMNLAQTVQDITKLGLEPRVSLSHVTNGPGEFHYMGVVTGVRLQKLG